MAATPPIGTVHTFPDPPRRTAREAHRVEQFEFGGDGKEYFRIWIVNLALTLVTLGIYSAWAKVRRLRYFYGNTRLAGTSLEYHGMPAAILKGRLIALASLVPYLALSYFRPGWELAFLPLFFFALPFIIVRARRFVTRMSTWRGIQFAFTGTYREALRVYLLGGLLVVLTLGLWFPRFARDRQQFLTGSTRFGVTSFECEIRPGPYYQAFFAAGILFWIFQVAGSIAGSGLGFGMGGRIVAAYAGLLVGLTLGRAVIDAITMNAAYNGTSIAGHRFVSKLDAGQLMSLYFSNLLLTVITAGIYYPWAAVRVARYRLEHLSVEVNGDLDEFVAGERKSAPATGDELGELLDVDLGL